MNLFGKDSKLKVEIFQGRNINLGKKSKFQMGFETTTLCDLVGCSNH